MKLGITLFLAIAAIGFSPLPEGYAQLKKAEHAFLNPGVIILFDSQPSSDQFKTYHQFIEKVKDQEYKKADTVLKNHPSLLTA